MTIDVHGKYLVSMDTSCGRMQFELLPRLAPATVNNFVYLVDKHWYDGIVFHRVAGSIDIIQAGDPLCMPPSGTDCGTGGPGYQFKDELTGTEKYTTGTIAMANSGPNTNGSQFFITLGPRSDLNGKHTIFGRVVSGMDVMKKLAPRDPQKDPNAPPGDAVQSVVIEEK
jgi:peptidyl-prolyl cis-trans isomerase B (cyclophilin B)